MTYRTTMTTKLTDNTERIKTLRDDIGTLLWEDHQFSLVGDDKRMAIRKDLERAMKLLHAAVSS